MRNVYDSLGEFTSKKYIYLTLLGGTALIDGIMIIIRIGIFLFGAWIVFRALNSALNTFVLPRGMRDPVTATVFTIMRRFVINPFVHRANSFVKRDHYMAYFAPISLMLLIPTWYLMVASGYMLMYWASGTGSLYQAFVTSGSSLLTLGFAAEDDTLGMLLVFSEATIGLLLVALLIAYLPTMYTAFSKREAAVTRLEVRAGSPPSAIEFLTRHQRLQRLNALTEVWRSWEEWFSELEESHTSLAALVFFRSPEAGKSWVTASGAILDAAALYASTLDVPRDAQAEICIRSGFLAMRKIADFFGFPYHPEPTFPNVSISIHREEFDIAYDTLQEAGIPLKDREFAWQNYAGWRVNYDELLIWLCKLTMAPYAPWSSDRVSKEIYTPRFRFSRK